MVASNTNQSKLWDSSSPRVLVCGFAQERALPDGNNTPLNHLSFVEGDAVPPKDFVKHFDLCYPSEADCRYSRSNVHSSHCIYSRGHCCSSEQVSDAGSDSCPASPINVSSCKKRHQRPRQAHLTQRESLLKEAWGCKRELHYKEFANFKECADVRTLGRSSSDCNKNLSCMGNHASLERSKSDCGKSNKDPLITPSRGRRTRTRSLTNDDFEELKGFLDLGFGFDQRSIPDLCETLPALEAVSAVTQTFQDSLTASPDRSFVPSPSPSWRIIRPGDSTEEMKEKLRHWAQAVACSARLYPSIGKLTSANVIQFTL